MTAETPQPLKPGDVRYYRLSGECLRDEPGFDKVHDELENAGHEIFAGIREIGRIGGREVNGDSQSVPKAEIALLEDLSEEAKEKVRKLGASVTRLEHNSELHRHLFPDAA